MKAKYEIWQLPMSNKNVFRSFRRTKDTLTIEDYVMVYASTCTYNNDYNLEDIFFLLNQNHPADYHARSLSVSDLICIIDSRNERRWKYVDSFGFQDVTNLINMRNRL